MSGLFGFYRGKVVKHCKDGFCKVFIPGIYPDEFENNPDALPDAEQASPLFGGGTQGNGMISIPDVNATVWCFFQNGDQNLPVYFAMSFPNDEGTSPFGEVQSGTDDGETNTFLTGEDAQNHMMRFGKCRVYFSESGQIEIRCDPDDEEESSEESQSEGEEESLDDEKYPDKCAKIEFDGNGNVTVYGNTNVTVKAPTVELIGDTVNITSDQFNVNSNVVNLDSNCMASTQKTFFTLKSPAFNVDASANIILKTPSMYVDATEGSFIAKGKTYPPVIAM